MEIEGNSSSDISSAVLEFIIAHCSLLSESVDQNSASSLSECYYIVEVALSDGEWLGSSYLNSSSLRTGLDIRK